MESQHISLLAIKRVLKEHDCAKFFRRQSVELQSCDTSSRGKVTLALWGCWLNAAESVEELVELWSMNTVMVVLFESFLKSSPAGQIQAFLHAQGRKILSFLLRKNLLTTIDFIVASEESVHHFDAKLERSFFPSSFWIFAIISAF